MTLITVVISTYNRPDTLKVAIQSVLAQEFSEWNLIVIGDCCDLETEIVINSYGDKRILYVNLKSRFGEQSGPNSIGMMLAESEYIALLNHDDVFLPDHLSIAIDNLQKTNADIFIGRSAFSRFSVAESDGRRPVFSEVSSANRELRDIFWRTLRVFEPSSSWVFRRALVERIGHWRPALTIYRAPIEDWLLRAWRNKAKLVTGDRISVLKIGDNYKPDPSRGSYQESPVHKTVSKFLYFAQTDALRQSIRFEIEQMINDPRAHFPLYVFLTPKQVILRKIFLNKITALFYWLFGLDSYTLFCWIIGRSKGYIFASLLPYRTGETLSMPPDVKELLLEVRDSLAQERHSGVEHQ